MVRPDFRCQKEREEAPSHPSSLAIGAADKATGASAAATTSVDLLQERAPPGRSLTRVSIDRPHLDCPRCGSAHTRFRGFRGRAQEKPQYFCSSCRRGWTRGVALRQRRKKKPHAPSAPPLLAPPATHQASHAAAVAVSVPAGFPAEPPLEGDGLECSWGSAFLEWIDQFLQTRMQEDFKAAFLGGSEERDGCARPPSPLDGDQEPEHKLQQQQLQEQGPPLLLHRGQGLF